MKKVIIITIVCLLVCQPAHAAENRELSRTDMEQTILRLLSNSMLDAIKDYYGQPRLFWPDSDKLISVRQVPNTPYYEIVIQVETFFGPHNPPYGIETMTFYIGYGEVLLKKFEHQQKSS